MKPYVCLLCFSILSFACVAEKPANTDPASVAPVSIPSALMEKIGESKAEFLSDLALVLSHETDNLLVLTDKKHPLSSGFIPPALVPLAKGRPYVVVKSGLSLRSAAEKALNDMAIAARNDGITLIASSTYRSYAYQKTVYERNVREMGQVAADRVSAKPGASQHQLGTAVDFGSITDDFAHTPAGKWLSAHGREYGWSLSFPDGYEKVTGYRWECWHYRYIGPEAAAFQKKWFGDIQQYMLEFIDAWKKR